MASMCQAYSVKVAAVDCDEKGVSSYSQQFSCLKVRSTTPSVPVSVQVSYVASTGSAYHQLIGTDKAKALARLSVLHNKTQARLSISAYLVIV